MYQISSTLQLIKVLFFLVTVYDMDLFNFSESLDTHIYVNIDHRELQFGVSIDKII